MPEDSPLIDISGDEFAAFCDFVVQIRTQGTENITPEQSVEEFRHHQAQLRRWQGKNRLSQEQFQLGEAKPLDDEAVLTRLRNRIAQERTRE